MKLLRELTDCVRSAAQGVRENKLRSALATLGIVIGIFTVILMAAALSGLTNSYERSIAALGSDVLYVQKFAWGASAKLWQTRNRRSINIETARRLAERATNALAISIEATSLGTVTWKNRTASRVFIAGNTEASALVRGLTLKDGRFFSAQEVAGGRPVCVLGSELAEKLFPSGNALGEIVRISDQPYSVIGIADKMGQFAFGNLDNQVIIPLLRYASDIVSDPEAIIAIKLGNAARLPSAEEELRGIMRTIRKVPPGEEDDFAISSQQALLDSFAQFTTAASSAGLFITGLALFVGGVGVMNVMFVSVTERTREIGIRKAIGAKRRTVLFQFVLESSFICLMGGLIALTSGWLVTLVMSRFLPVTFSPAIAVIALIVSGLTGLLAGYFPARRAAYLNPIDALRNE